MSEMFEISKVFVKNLKAPEGFLPVSVKTKDKKWKNFPPSVVFENVVGNLENVKTFKILPDDIFLCGFPRSGTTLMQEMIWLIVRDFDFEESKSEILDARFPVLESIQSNQEFYAGKAQIDLESMKRPRTIKTHLPVQLLPDDFWKIQPKTIFISRDPRDVAVSVYHCCKSLFHYEISYDDFIEAFLSDKFPGCPYRENYVDYLNIPDYENILYLTYESVTANIDEAILKVAKFLGKEISEENLKLLKEHLKIENMKKNDSCNNKQFMERMNEITGKNQEIAGFIRKGKTGNYKEEMSEELVKKFEAWMKEFKEMKSSFNSTKL